MYFLLINKESHFTYKEIEKGIPKTVSSLEFLKGFAQGFTFGKFKIFTSEDVCREINLHGGNTISKYHIFPISLLEPLID